MLLWPFNKYPGTDYETFNWEWILKTVKDWVARMTEFVSNMTDAWNVMRQQWSDYQEGLNDDWQDYQEGLNDDWQDYQDNLNDQWQEFIDDTYKDQITEILEQHPEWVTTVMDGAITAPKLNPAFLKSIQNYFVIPEMFGAVGDGVTDDSATFQDAIDSGLPVYGLFDKTYVVHDLQIGNNTIGFCKFKPGATGQTAFIAKSGARIINCDFSEYEYCVVKDASTPLVHAMFEHNWFRYSKFGVYLDSGNNSINNCIINNNYFSKNGINPDDYSTAPSAGAGYGLALIGNWDGLAISGNVFEYNTYCGIYAHNSNINYRTGANITGNYFEGNKEAAIEVSITYAANMLEIIGNYFSARQTNVTGSTRYMKWLAGRTRYEIEDGEKTFTIARVMSGSTNILDPSTNTATYDDTSSQYWSMEKILTDTNMTMTKIEYDATLSSNVSVRNGAATSEVLGTIANGRGSFEFPSTIDTFYITRTLSEGESITIRKIH